MFLRADSELQCLCEAQSWLHGLKLNFLPMSPHVLLEVREGISIDIIQQSVSCCSSRTEINYPLDHQTQNMKQMGTNML